MREEGGGLAGWQARPRWVAKLKVDLATKLDGVK